MYGSGPRTRRTFLVGLGRFLAIAPLSALVKPPVLYSFPSVLKPLNMEMIEIEVTVTRVPREIVKVMQQMYTIAFDIDRRFWLVTMNDER